MTTMQRSKLAREFGIKEIHFVPTGDGRVIEYGTPSGEEVMCLQLLSLLIEETASTRSPKTFFYNIFEILGLLRLIVVIEGPLHIVAGIRKATTSMLQGTMSHEEAMKRQARLAGQKMLFRKITMLRLLVLQPISFVVTGLTYLADAYADWRYRSRTRKLQA